MLFNFIKSVPESIIIITITLIIIFNILFSKDLSNNLQGINPKALDLAKKAWNHEKYLNPSLKPILTVVDFTKPDYETRFYVIDLTNNTILYSSLVAHGANSGLQWATSFSNHAESHKSSIGAFLTKDTYYGHNGYSLHLQGLETGFNDNAHMREIVVHGSDYVNPAYVGHSWGCFALPKGISTNIINTIKDNTLIFAYYPDPTYLHTSRYING